MVLSGDSQCTPSFERQGGASNLKWSLCSIYEDKLRRKQLNGARTSSNCVSLEYFAAWEFSTQFCSVYHPGTAPCFFPPDFSRDRMESSEYMYSIRDCPAHDFYQEYHLKKALSVDLRLLPGTQADTVQAAHSSAESGISVSPATTLIGSASIRTSLDLFKEKVSGLFTPRLSIKISRNTWNSTDTKLIEGFTSELHLLVQLLELELRAQHY